MSFPPLSSRARLRRPASRILFVLALGGALAGCATVDRVWDMPGGNPYRPDNHTAVGAIPADMRRVGLLPLHSEEWSIADIATLDAAFSAELGKFDRFEVLPIPRGALAERFDRRSFLSSAALPSNFLERLRADFGLDAALFIDLTHYSPYQPISIGVRGKLVALRSGEVLWSFDSIFDSAQPDVALAARQYHQKLSRPAHPLENTAGILQSPARFSKYVANAMFETLPPREMP